MFTTYILYSKSKDIFYVGFTGNLMDRLKRHNGGRSIYTKIGIPGIIVYQKQYPTKSEAYQAELYI